MASTSAPRAPQKQNNKPASGGWLKREFRKRPLPVWILVVADVLLLGISLVVFALFHHVLPSRGSSEGVVISRSGASSGQAALSTLPPVTSGDSEETTYDPQNPLSALDEESAEETDEDESAGEEGDEFTDAFGDTAVQSENATTEEAPTFAAEADADPVGYFGTKFADKFTNGEVIRDGLNYKSANVNVTITAYEDQDPVFYVADIYVRDIEYLRTGFAKDTYGKGYKEWTDAMCSRLGGVVGINGDYYGMRADNVVIRNGQLYRSDDSPKRDVCVIYWDGTMETYSPKEFDMDAVIAKSPYQAWNFGPKLLDADGNPMTKFNSNVTKRNPRTAIGYFEPGHYCFVVVDGRAKKSHGAAMEDLSKLMARLGCVRAYNLDGGQTSMMAAGALVVNQPSSGGRQCSDIVLVVDSLENQP